jgi:inner membrane protein
VATFGHIAAGLAIGQAGATRPGWVATLAIVVAAILPDVDLLLDVNHRGPTHSIGFAALVGLVAFGVLRIRGERSAVVIGVLCALATLSHVVLDLLTAPSPVAVFWPLSGREFGLSEPPLPAAPTDESLLTVRGLALVAGEAAWSVAVVLVAVLAGRRAPRPNQA